VTPTRGSARPNRPVSNPETFETSSNSSSSRNPFTPGAGYPPPYLAGRDVVLAEFERHLDSAARIPKHFVLTGLRGTGKTVLLREFQNLLTRKHWLWSSRELDDTANQTSLLLAMLRTDLTRIGTGASLALRLQTTGKVLADTLKPQELTAWGVSYSPAYAPQPEPPPRDLLIQMLEGLMRVVGNSHVGVALLFDEFHEVWDGRWPRQSPLATLFGAIKQIQLSGYPVIVVASGLPSVVPNIVKSRSYLERDLAVTMISSLADGDARAAIAEPLSQTTITFSESLIMRIVTETRGYPYFLQYYSSFLIDSVPDRDYFDVEAFEELRPVLVAALDQSFFAGRFWKLPKAERDTLMAIAREGEQVRLANLRWAGNPQTLRVAVARLVEHGHLYRTASRGEVSFTLPLYRDFLLRVSGTEGRDGA